MSDEAAPTERREYFWNLMAAIILSLATLASAWCGYQASSWNSIYSTESRTANGARHEAARQSSIADRQLSSDLLIFATWLEAEIKGDSVLAQEVELRFRDHFRPAYDAWRAEPIGVDGHLPDGTPFERPEYVLPTQAAADEANAQATAALDAADRAGAASSRYVLTSVLFASVLFLAGIAAKLSNQRLAHGVVAVAALALLAALWLLITSPLNLGAI